MNTNIKIKGQSIDTWLNWINNELTPPINISDQVKYVLEAFKDSLEIIKNK